MSVYRNNNQHNYNERSTASIYELRRAGRIDEAYQKAIALYQQNDDDDVKKALSWVLIDLCKKYIAEKNLEQAQIYYNQLSEIQIDYEDEFVETIQKQIRFLQPKIDISYNQIQQAENLSKNGQEQQAMDIIRSLIANNQLSELHHETYGWIIYRYIKSQENAITSIQVRTLLRDYMNLKNERPSMLHSMILNYALNYSKTHSDFNFYQFFVLWNPLNLRYEDLHDGNKDGQTIPSLISRICREFVNSNTVMNSDELLETIKLDRETVLDFFREPYFWNLYHAYQENRLVDLWNLFSKYNETYAKYGKSKWHSEILKIADRNMTANEAWRFLQFFKDWNPANFMDADWKEERGKDGETYKPLAIKALKKSFESIKNQQDKNNLELSWLIATYEEAIKLYPDDEWLIREKALLHIWQNDFDSAKAIYKKLVMLLGDKYYIWQEFAECFEDDNNLKVAMLSKALCLEKHEDFLGEIHLNLAKALVAENLLENTLFELETYKKHRMEKGWKLSQEFTVLSEKAKGITVNINSNQELYYKYIPQAEEYAYQDIEWTKVVLVDRWKDDKGKDRVAFTDGNSIEFSVAVNRFGILKQSTLGQVFRFKLDKEEIKKEAENKIGWQSKIKIAEYKHVPLLAENTDEEVWSILPTVYGYVEYVNKEKQTLHIYTNENNEVFCKYEKEFFKTGDFLVAKRYSKTIKDENRIFLIKMEKIEKQNALTHFKNRVVVVDDVNEIKKLFHYVLEKGLLTGIAFFEDTDIRPNVGDFLKVHYYVKKDKTGKKKLVSLFVEKTEETDDKLKKTVSGKLEIKDGGFAFVCDCYVSKKILEQFDITDDCYVTAEAVYTGESDKWKVIEIEKRQK